MQLLSVMDKEKEAGMGSKYQYTGIRVLYISYKYLHRPSQDVKSPTYRVVISKSTSVWIQTRSAPVTRGRQDVIQIQV